MLGLICCATNKVQQDTTPAQDVYIPKFPEPKESVVIPLDSDFHIVVPTEEDPDPEVMYVMVLYWYWNLIIDWKVKITRAVKTLMGE